VRERGIDLKAIPGDRPKPNKRDHAVATVAQLFDFDSDLLPRFDEGLPKAANAFGTVVDSVHTRETLKAIGESPFDLRISEFEQLIEVPPVPGFVAQAHDLHVLLRHRPRSISPKGAALHAKQ
jgi:hypothetical protein